MFRIILLSISVLIINCNSTFKNTDQILNTNWKSNADKIIDTINILDQKLKSDNLEQDKHKSFAEHIIDTNPHPLKTLYLPEHDPFSPGEIETLSKTLIKQLRYLNKVLEKQDISEFNKNDSLLINFLFYYNYLLINTEEFRQDISLASLYYSILKYKNIDKFNYKERSNLWNENDRTIKLRIICAELIYQVEKWINARRESTSAHFNFKLLCDTFHMFTRLYLKEF